VGTFLATPPLGKREGEIPPARGGPCLRSAINEERWRPGLVESRRKRRKSRKGTLGNANGLLALTLSESQCGIGTGRG